jgi:kumamolisin
LVRGCYNSIILKEIAMGGYVPLAGSKKTPKPNARPVGPVDLSQVASLTVRVRSVGNRAELAEKVRALSEKSLSERKYFTHEELEAQHGARNEDLDRVEDYARRHDLVVVHRSVAERCVVLKGQLGKLLSAFPADLQIYHHPSGIYRGREGEIMVPEELRDIVTGVFGFDTHPKRRVSHRRKVMALSGPGGQNGVPATEFASRYNFPTQYEGVALDGTEQTIAFIELGGGYRTSDLEVFFKEIGLPLPNVSAVSVDHAGNDPTSADSPDGEVMLDLEVAGAVVPRASLVVYFTPNKENQGFINAVSTAVFDKQRKPSVISISWGGPEGYVDQQSLDAFHELFENAAALGITVCVATGDHGTAGMEAVLWDGKIHVDHPACDPSVLACGGTRIDAGKDIVWNDETPFDPRVLGGGGWASGGGISVVFPVPTYQRDAKLPVSIVTSRTGRGVPDIAMSAMNYFTRTDTAEESAGGTSAVAPLMAGLVARLNQAKKKNVGFLNPFLYANVAKGVVKDVTEGTNGIANTVQGYQAGPGWDACTGLGTPDGTAILNNLS